ARIKAARRVEADDEPTRFVDEWVGGGEERMLAEGRALLERDLGGGDGELADALDAALDLAHRGNSQHFLLHGAGVYEIGRLGLELERDHGWSGTDIAALFTGLSGTSPGPGRAPRA